MTADQTTHWIEEILKDKKARDVETIDIEGKTILADAFVIATGTSTTHVKSLADEVEFEMKDKHGIVPGHIEGHAGGRWVLMDYGDIVVHIFHDEERRFYSIEKLWRQSRI